MTTEKEQPTAEQLQKFWEWCGFKVTKEPYSDGNSEFSLDTWTHKSGYFGTEMPTFDLNNLFKYAVPKVLRFHLQRSYQNRELFHAEIDYPVGDEDGFSCYQAEHQDPALALFWAIWKVIQ